MVLRAIRIHMIIITAMAVSICSHAWKNPFQPDIHVYRADGTEEPAYNITTGSLFGIYVEPGIDPISEFERKPYIYVTKTEENQEGVETGLTKKIKVKILSRDSHYPSGKLEFPCQLVICEWEGKLAPNSYELWIQPKNKGTNLEPSRVTGDFRLKQPVIQSVDSTVSRSSSSPVSSAFANIDVGEYSNPAFGDIDGDGDLDLLVGRRTGDFVYFENTGTATAPVFTQREGASDPFNGFRAGGSNYSAPFFTDLDRNGDLDLIAGSTMTTGISYFQNNGSVTNPAFQPHNIYDNIFDYYYSPARRCNLTMADIDGDGVLDLMYTNERHKNIYFYRNNSGDPNLPLFTNETGSATDPFKNIVLESTSTWPYVTIAFIDLNIDGVLDLVSSNAKGRFYYHQNVDTATNPIFQQANGSYNPFANISVDNASYGRYKWRRLGGYGLWLLQRKGICI